MNPFGYAKLTTFIVMCKPYGSEPSADLFRGFFNLYPGGEWLTFAKRPEADVPTILFKPITRIENWKRQFFYVQDTIVANGYSELLSKDNRNFMFAEDDEKTTFLHRELYPGFGCGSPFASINNEPPLLEVKPLDNVNLEQLVKNTASICPLIELRLLNWMSCSLNSMVHLATLLDFSGLARICLMGLSVNTLMGELGYIFVAFLQYGRELV
nr:hypothetical protein [Tanacetum cinerariifolium]